jgi:serine/threonine protein kinase
MRQAVQAVAYMHALVPIVLHNDLKPGNVMIEKGCLSTMLCDMGISRIQSDVLSIIIEIASNSLSTFQASFSEKNSIRVTPYDHISVAVEDLA